MRHPIDKYIGDKIISIRKKRSLTQDDVAKHLNISRQQVQKYESGETRISVSTLYELCHILNIDLDSFLHDVNNLQLSEDNKSKDNDIIQQQRSTPLQIFIIEDSNTDELLTRRAIEECNVPTQISSSDTGDEALNILKKNEKISPIKIPDLILLDLNLPKLTGLEILRSLKQDRQLKNIPIIIITNSLSIKEMKKVYENGASGYIVKSFYPEEFFRKIKIIIEYWSNMVLPRM